jgi:hypothetical protein
MPIRVVGVKHLFAGEKGLFLLVNLSQLAADLKALKKDIT